MYDEYLNNEVVVIVSTRTEVMWEYTGYLVQADETSLKLKDVSINQALLSFQKNIFGSGMSTYKSNLKEVILNKNYIISCYKK